MKNIEPLESLITGEYISSDIAERMPYVKAGSAGVGEHVEYIKLGLRLRARQGIIDPVDVLLLPVSLPLLLDLPECVFHIRFNSAPKIRNGRGESEGKSLHDEKKLAIMKHNTVIEAGWGREYIGVRPMTTYLTGRQVAVNRRAKPCLLAVYWRDIPGAFMICIICLR